MLWLGEKLEALSLGSYHLVPVKILLGKIRVQKTVFYNFLNGGLKGMLFQVLVLPAYHFVCP